MQTAAAMSMPGRVTAALVIVSLGGAACAPKFPGRGLELYVAPTSYDFKRNPELLQRIEESPYGYFRFINERFIRSICTRFEDDLADMPKVNLHGDGHMEQYSITETGRGLSDFDDASVGPAVVDLVRAGVSIELIADEKGWPGEGAALVEEFLLGYRAALENPATEAPSPHLVDRIRARFSADRGPLLAWADSLMDPEGLSPAAVQQLIGPFASAIFEKNPDLPLTYFDVKKAGRHRLGVGSALDEKYLLRVEGPTGAPEDDVLVEVKQIRDLSAIPCIERLPRDPSPILNAQSRIAYEPYRFTGFLHLGDSGAGNGGSRSPGGRSFWLHTWVDHYYEISGDDLESIDDLRELVFDVGVQLGRGHPKDILPDDAELRRAELESLNRYQGKIERTIDELLEETVRAWEAFRSQTAALAH